MNPQRIDQQRLVKRLPARALDSHKGLFGKVVAIGGASGMTGAAILAARAALKSGAGSVYVVLLTGNPPAVDFIQPELMLHDATTQLPYATVRIVGCGMGCDAVARNFLQDSLQSQSALVLDADALNLIALHAELRELLAQRNAPTVLTPHPGEAARLLACSTEDIQSDRITSVQKLAKIFSCTVILKGAGSLCATREGLYINTTGNPGMSGPGMGDALAGMIAAFIAQGMNTDDAALLAICLHGAAGDELSKQGITIGMTASELTDQARQLLNQWRSI
jgi:hydroxyethylthiazole kinase-like uncharacterized protein yjeF